jgi:Ribonucleotide reductase, beta subunit
MPDIVNIRGINNSNIKKISSKLSFQIGEIISARVLKNGNGSGELILKLNDGWQFPVNLLEQLEEMPQGILRFQVTGFENGKITVRFLPASVEKQQKTEDKAIEDVLLQNNLGDEEQPLLEKLLVYGMPLTKTNISKMKGLNDFINKINLNEQEEDNFIDKYIASKNMQPESEEAKQVKTDLKGFFTSLKELKIDDILTLIENNIDLTSENIESYKRVFKSDNGLFNSIKNIQQNLPQLLPKANHNEIHENILNGNYDILNNFFEGKMSDDIQNEIYKGKIESGFDNKNDENANLNQNKVLNKLINGYVKDTPIPSKSISAYSAKSQEDVGTKITTAIDLLRGLLMQNDEINYILKDIILDKSSIINPNDLNTILDNLKGIKDEDVYNSIKNVLNSNEEYKNVSIKDLLNYDHSSVAQRVVSKAINNLLGKNCELNKKDVDIILKSLKNQIEEAENLIGKDKNNFSKNNVHSIEEIFLDSSNLNKAKGTNARNQALDLKNSFQLVKEQIDIKNNEIKHIVRDLMVAKNELKPEAFNEIISNIKDNVNDFKVFNEVSNQYYYMDLPLTLNKNEYSCKLIIKDDRKNIKKIDSKNIKMVVNVKTINMGTVDAFIKLSDNNISIEVKCLEKWMEALKLGKGKLEKSINNIGYNCYINVEKKTENIDISTCREFFNDNNLSNIDTVV